MGFLQLFFSCVFCLCLFIIWCLWQACAGVLTMRGGMTSHAAVVARSLGRPSVTGASAYGMSLCHRSSTAAKATAATGVSVEQAAGALAGTGDLYFLSCKDGRVLHKGDLVTIDGSHGDVYSGEIPTVPAGRDPDYQTLLRWADQVSQLLSFRKFVLVNVQFLHPKMSM